ncbi:MAG: cell division protein FtsQ/DivIB [Cytophagales bacterium]|nr:cell division protein FtsQ/DivIB [Cytophagales bacterium]
MIHIRQPYTPASQQAPDVPEGIVWMQRGTRALLALLAFIALALALRALILAPWFSIQKMHISGESSYDVQFNNALTIRANVLPQLSGNYFTLNLRQVQKAFESLPWIRSAVVRREFPNQINVSLTAHTPIARWTSLDASSAAANSDVEMEHLLSVQGEVFETSGGQLDTDNLPALAGPQAKAAEVLALYQSLQSLLQTHAPHAAHPVVQLRLSPLGLWRAVLANQATIELGAGNKEVIVARTARWLAAAPQVAERFNARDVQSVDLRYPNGFATRLSGITTR